MMKSNVNNHRKNNNNNNNSSSNSDEPAHPAAIVASSLETPLPVTTTTVLDRKQETTTDSSGVVAATKVQMSRSTDHSGECETAFVKKRWPSGCRQQDESNETAPEMIKHHGSSIDDNDNQHDVLHYESATKVAKTCASTSTTAAAAAAIACPPRNSGADDDPRLRPNHLDASLGRLLDLSHQLAAQRHSESRQECDKLHGLAELNWFAGLKVVSPRGVAAADPRVVDDNDHRGDDTGSCDDDDDDDDDNDNCDDNY